MDDLKQELTSFLGRYSRARNAHDAADMSAHFAEDADLVGANGKASIGRDAIRANFEAEHASVYRDSVAERRLERVVDLGGGLVAATGRFAVTGTRAKRSDAPIRQPPGIFTLVCRRGGQYGWEIVLYRSMVPSDVFHEQAED